MTDWETTKIKKPVKEKAAEDPRTYTEIMQAGLDTSGNTHTQGNQVTTNSGEIVDQITAEMDAMAFNGQVQDDKADEIIGRIKDLHTEIQKLNERLQR